MSDTVSRGHLVEHLARAFHRARIQQGTNEEVDEVTATDRENAKTTVTKLEELGVYERKQPGAIAAALRHPVVAGLLLALFTGLIASVLVPALTRSWQDRPRELALKRELVARIAREGSTAVDSASVGAGPRRGRAFYDRMIRRWRTESSIIGAELTTYFPTSEARRKWKDYARIVNYLLQTVAYGGGRSLAGDSLIRDHFRNVRFDDPVDESMRKEVMRGAVAKDESVVVVSVLLLDERDQIAGDIVKAKASGFSHGFWIFS